MPVIVIGALLSGVVERCLSRETVVRVFPKSRALGIAASACLGLIFPMCECGIVPVVRRLVRKGVPVSCAVTYMLASPIINPLVIVSTLVAFRGRGAWAVAGLRVGMGFVVAVVLGVVVWRVLGEKKVLLGGGPPDDAHAHDHPRGGVVRDVLVHAARDFLEIGATLVVGAAIAALVNSGFHRAAMAPFAANPFAAVGSMSGLAIGLNLCSEADAFVAASFYAFPLPAKMAFLVLGPMVDVKLIAMYTTVFRPRAIVAISGLTAVLIFILCVTGYKWMAFLAPIGV
jgi:uncharacterized membrane protein YraQ (UPF0718 family)